MARYDSEGLLDQQRVVRHYSSAAHHSVGPHSHFFHPLHRDQNLVVAPTGREHLARTREIAGSNVLSTPCQQRSNVPLREMLTWHEGHPDRDDDEREWVVEHLTPGRGMVKRTCRRFAQQWTPASAQYAHNGFLAKLQKRKQEERRNQGLGVRQSAFL
eukprot:TRINITY_DN13481_c0_g1_i1.p1 TRINITY_DN13481_c0_g1~~TRINITY_DN13481_c0_g1_i1.p1  ORF type:complete len:158 (-),score=28.21 TRINITY_DN13481_c0_g1_i1:433-906(-)